MTPLRKPAEIGSRQVRHQVVKLTQGRRRVDLVQTLLELLERQPARRVMRAQGGRSPVPILIGGANPRITAHYRPLPDYMLALPEPAGQRHRSPAHPAEGPGDLPSSARPGDAATARQPVSRQHAGTLPMFTVRAIGPSRTMAPDSSRPHRPCHGREAHENLPLRMPPGMVHGPDAAGPRSGVRIGEPVPLGAPARGGDAGRRSDCTVHSAVASASNRRRGRDSAAALPPAAVATRSSAAAASRACRAARNTAAELRRPSATAATAACPAAPVSATIALAPAIARSAAVRCRRCRGG
jgi:hypothetical protein